MARKQQLREQRTGTVINLTSKTQEGRLGQALQKVEDAIKSEFPVSLRHDRRWYLKDIVRPLREQFPEIEFHYHHDTSHISPDGGFLSIVDCNNNAYPILITEVKNQGTNDFRATEGKPRQARGNAIERLGKNVIAFRSAMKSEHIMPFVCFGDGCDFEEESSILDRVTTIAMFGPLNKIQLENQGGDGAFDRGSFYFRVEQWTSEEMSQIMLDIARRSIFHYYGRYGDAAFDCSEI